MVGEIPPSCRQKTDLLAPNPLFDARSEWLWEQDIRLTCAIGSQSVKTLWTNNEAGQMGTCITCQAQFAISFVGPTAARPAAGRACRPVGGGLARWCLGGIHATWCSSQSTAEQRHSQGGTRGQAGRLRRVVHCIPPTGHSSFRSLRRSAYIG